MSVHSKDKRTKEQILGLLDKVMEQEEQQSEKIKNLEAALAECRKNLEDPRHALAEEAIQTSKISFRIDFYRTSEKSPLRGIIEHLPSRQNHAFEGEGQEVIGDFILSFLQDEPGKNKKKKPVASTRQPSPSQEEMPAVISTESAGPALAVKESSRPSLLERLKANLASEELKPQVPVAAVPLTRAVQEPPASVGKSRLIERLRRQHSGNTPAGSIPLSDVATAKSTQGKFTRHSRLLERLRAESRSKMP